MYKDRLKEEFTKEEIQQYKNFKRFIIFVVIIGILLTIIKVLSKYIIIN